MITTDRLILRRWRESDVAPYVALNQDPHVTAYFPGIQSAEESGEDIEHFNAMFDLHGYTFWAVEERASGAFIGFVGLLPLRGEPIKSDGVEIGWRLAHAHWGKGYATEGARASLVFGFENLGLGQIVAFTSVENARSRAVMTRIGMTHAAGEEFDYPHFPEDCPFRRQVLYRLTKDGWQDHVACYTGLQ